MARCIGKIVRTPFPFRALLAISSDLDDTPDWKHYFELIRFLNTDEKTIFGRGVNLEFANSLLFNEPTSPVAYTAAGSADRGWIRELIKTGHIDTLHSFGANELSRSGAHATLDHLEENGCRFATWTDHWISPTNFDPFKRTAQGSRQGSAAYCADLLASHGVNYVWAGRLTTVVGQNTPMNVQRLLAGRPANLKSARTTTSEIIKLALGQAGFGKYSMRAANRLQRDLQLSDGSRFLEFLRSYTSSLTLHQGDSADGLSSALSPNVIESLITSRGVMAVYTHLGRRTPRPGEAGHDEFYRTLKMLSDLEAQGALKTLSTTRLLDFVTLQQRLKPVLLGTRDGIEIHLNPDPQDSLCAAALRRSGGRGVSVVVPRAARARFRVMGAPPFDGKMFSPVSRDVSIASIPLGSLPEVPI